MTRFFGFALVALFLMSAGCAQPPSAPPEKAGEEPAAKETVGLAFDRPPAEEDPFNDENGPFYHNIFAARSTDGLNFGDAELVVGKASVPDVVKTDDGTIFLYAVDGSGRSRSNALVGLSEDRGKNFKFGSLRIKGRSDQQPLADPQAVLLPDNRIRLFYVVFPAKQPPLDEAGRPIPTGDPLKIKSAVSSDGINFEEEAGTRLETTRILTDPDVARIGDRWFMYLSDGEELVVAVSSDGDNYRLEDSIRARGSVSKTVPVGDGRYRQFFCAEGISTATTTDGLVFSPEARAVIAEKPGRIVCDPTPVNVGEEWLLFYKEAPLPKKGPPPGPRP